MNRRWIATYMQSYALRAILCVVIVGFSLVVWAASTGLTLTGGGTDAGGGDAAWSNISNITADDGAYASHASMGSGDVSNNLEAHTFGFSLPATATIDGIEVRIQCRSGAASDIEIGGVRLTKAGTPVGSTKLAGTGITTTFVDYDAGGAADLWGTTWLYSDINSSGFGISVFFDAVGSSATTRIDAIWINVHYTDSGGASNNVVKMVI